MDEKRKEEEVRELTPEEIDDMILEEQIASGEYDEEVSEYYFSNPDPYAKVEPRPDDAPKRDIKFDENGNIVVKNLSAFWLPELTIVDEVGGAEYTVTGSYEGTTLLGRDEMLCLAAALPGKKAFLHQLLNGGRPGGRRPNAPALSFFRHGFRAGGFHRRQQSILGEVFGRGRFALFQLGVQDGQSFLALHLG